MFNNDTKFTVLGLARSGISAAYKLKNLGFEVFISDMKSSDAIPESAQLQIDFPCQFGSHTDKCLDCDVMIVSPGIPLNVPILKKARSKNITLISEIELGYLLKHADTKIIAVTGTNGKSTTVSLIDHILKTAGYTSILAGNIGDAFTSFDIESPGIDFFVLELSSFQLDLIDEFHPDVAAILNITPDHLNRYDSFEDYVKAKFHIFANQSWGDLSILNIDDPVCVNHKNLIEHSISWISKTVNGDVYWQDNLINTEDDFYAIDKATLRGPHNQYNMAAAVLAVSRWVTDPEIIEKAFNTFKPLTHRMELFAEIDGVKYYNDSKATNTDSVKYALQSFTEPVHIILGGSGKGEDYNVLIPLLKKHAQAIYLIGDARNDMAAAFDDSLDYTIFDPDDAPLSSFDLAVEEAMKNAVAGEVVLLSPACTSYDMFENFEKRGDYFKKLVKEKGNAKK